MTARYNVKYIAAMKLNIKKIKQELKKRGWTQQQYADELQISKQLLSYHLNTDLKSLKVVELLAKPLQLNPKDLII